MPLARSSRAYLVLDTAHGQSVEWAVQVGMIDPAQFRQPELVGRSGGTEVWAAARR
jgi:hypothetical protein